MQAVMEGPPPIHNTPGDATTPAAATGKSLASTNGSSSSPMGSESGFGVRRDGQLQLPSLEVILPILQDFFHQYNHLMPLFHEPTFMRMVKNWYMDRSPAEWAAIHVALALCFRIVYGVSMEDPRVADSIAAVKSMALKLSMRTEDHLGVQVLLGLTILSLGTPTAVSHRDSAIYTSMACRLVQLVQLNRRSMGNIPDDQALHQSRLFWIAFILDRVKSDLLSIHIAPLIVPIGCRAPLPCPVHAC
jgi:hypothetical protein